MQVPIWSESLGDLTAFFSAEGHQGDAAKERTSRAISPKSMGNLIEPCNFLLCFLALTECSSHHIHEPIEKFRLSNLAHVHLTDDVRPEHSRLNPIMQVTCVMG